MADPGGIGLDMEYLPSMDSIFKIAESALGLITFICACVWGTHWGGGWVQFVSITAFILMGALFGLKLFRIIYKLPEAVPVPLIEFITCAVYTLFFMICGIVAAVKAQNHSSIGAAAFFSFASMLVFGVDTFFKFRTWREGGGTFQSPTTTTTTTTTTTDPQTAEAGKAQQY